MTLQAVRSWLSRLLSRMAHRVDPWHGLLVRPDPTPPSVLIWVMGAGGQQEIRAVPAAQVQYIVHVSLPTTMEIQADRRRLAAEWNEVEAQISEGLQRTTTPPNMPNPPPSVKP